MEDLVDGGVTVAPNLGIVNGEEADNEAAEGHASVDRNF